MAAKRDFLISLREAEVFKFGEFTLKSGQISPIYIDFRNLISYPNVMRHAVNCLWETITDYHQKFGAVCGVPYGAVPYASIISVDYDLPMICRRKEPKDHGTKKLIEGKIDNDMNCLIVEDVITSGSSVIETVQVLREEGITVTDAVVLLDRQQGAKEKLKENDIIVHSVLTLKEILDFLLETGDIDDDKKNEIESVLLSTVVVKDGTPIHKEIISWKLTDRLSSFKNAKAKKLVEIMERKQTNLCVAADLTSADNVLKLARQIGEHICMLKLHSYIIKDFSKKFIEDLKKCSEEMEFLLFEDRKFDDTGSTVELELEGPFDIASWADIVTVHSLPGPAVLNGMKQAYESHGVSCLLIAELSCKDSLTALPGYKPKTVMLAKQYNEMVVGFICQKRCSQSHGYLYVTPGVHLDSSGDCLGQQWRPPHQALVTDGNDIVVVGRGITKSADPAATALKYKLAAWQALLERK